MKVHRIRAPQPLPQDDLALVALALAGEEASVRMLVQRHNRRLYRVARAVLRNNAEAEDVVQETWVRAFTSLDGFRGDASFVTWLTRIALNEALGRVRRRRPTVSLDIMEDNGEQAARVIPFPGAPAPANPETDMARQQVRELLEQAVESLPEPFRIVLVLRDVEGFSIEETAAHLQLRPATVKTRLHRARKLMREALAERAWTSLPDLFPFDGARCDGIADRVLRRLAALRLAGS